MRPVVFILGIALIASDTVPLLTLLGIALLLVACLGGLRV